MKRLMILILLLGVLGVGCVRVNHKTDFPQNKPISMTSGFGANLQPVLVRHFRERDRQVYFFLFLVPLNHASGTRAAERHLGEGDGVANLNIRTFFGPADLFFTLISAGLFPTYTIDSEGDIFTWAKPAPPTVVVPPPPGGAVIVPPSPGGAVIVPPASGGTILVPPPPPWR